MKKIEFETVKDFFEMLIDLNSQEDGSILWIEVFEDSLNVYIGDELDDSKSLGQIDGFFCENGGYLDLSSTNYWTLSFRIKSKDLKVGKTYKMKIEHEKEEESDDIIEL